MATSPEVKLHSLLGEFSVAMLVTRTAEGELRARPMALADVEADDTLWFACGRHSGKVGELERDGHVGLTMQSNAKFVSISGTADTVDDKAKIAKLWKVEWKVWFPGGQDDPELTLLRVRCDAAEYWDNSGLSGIKYLIGAGKALLTGTRPDDVEKDPKIHGKVGK